MGGLDAMKLFIYLTALITVIGSYLKRRLIDMNTDEVREEFEKCAFSNSNHTIESKVVLVEKETGRVVAVFYNDYDLDAVLAYQQATKDNEEANNNNRIRLLQYESLRKYFGKMIDEVLGKDYYNMGMDVYECDRICCEDITFKAKHWWKKRALKEANHGT